MRIGLWNDEDRLFVRKTFGFGVTINLKYVAKRLGLIKSSPLPPPPASPDEEEAKPTKEESREDHLRRQIESSKVEQK